MKRIIASFVLLLLSLTFSLAYGAYGSDYSYDRDSYDDNDYYWARDYYASADYARMQYPLGHSALRSDSHLRYGAHNMPYNYRALNPVYIHSRDDLRDVDDLYYAADNRHIAYPRPYDTRVAYREAREEYAIRYSQTFDAYYLQRCHTRPPRGSIIYIAC